MYGHFLLATAFSLSLRLDVLADTLLSVVLSAFHQYLTLLPYLVFTTVGRFGIGSQMDKGKGSHIHPPAQQADTTAALP